MCIICMYVHEYVYSCVYRYTHVDGYTHVCMSVCIFIYIYCVCACMHIIKPTNKNTHESIARCRAWPLR